MSDDLAAARAAIQRATARTDDASRREHLRAIDEGLLEVTNEKAPTAARTQDEPPHGDDLESIESEIVDVASEADPPVRSHLETARDEIDEYRRAYTRDW